MYLGDFSGLYLAELVINMLGFHWATFIVFFSFLLAISVFLVHRYVDEYPIDFEPTNSLKEFVNDKLGNLRLIFCHSKRALAVVEATLLICFYFNILLWFPYYFTSLGYASYATNLSVIAPLLVFFGCLGFESLIKFCPNYSHWFISSLLLASTVCQFQMIDLADEPDASSAINHFFLLIFVSSLCFSGPINAVFMTELSFLTADDSKAAMYIFIVQSALQCLLSMGTTFLIGILLEISTCGIMQARIPSCGSCSSTPCCWRWWT